MAGFLESHPLIVLGVLIGNSLLVALFCYFGLRHCIGRKYLSAANVIPVARFIIETPERNNPHPTHAVLIDVERFSPNSNDFNRVASCIANSNGSWSDMSNDCENVKFNGFDNTFCAEEPPPHYYDIFPDERQIESTPQK